MSWLFVHLLSPLFILVIDCLTTTLKELAVMQLSRLLAPLVACTVGVAANWKYTQIVQPVTSISASMNDKNKKVYENDISKVA
jgi:hypothetical protein